jgi:hypothetical protein
MKIQFKSLLDDEAPIHTRNLESADDFKAIVKEFPQLKESLYKHSDLRAIAQDMCDYLSSHHMHAWISE